MTVNNWVLITGAARRLGREISLAFANAGWSIAIHYHQSSQAAEQLAANCQALGVDTLLLQADLVNELSCQKIWKELVQHTGSGLRTVVNNASMFEPDVGLEYSEDMAIRQLQANLLAPLRFGKWLAQLHQNQMVEQAVHPALIHILDQKVFNLNPDYFSYTLSKLALERAVSLQAQSLAPFIRVNGVAPGLLYPSGPQTQDNFKKAASVNLLRKPINPVDVASAVLFLATNSSITGTTVRVDNGQHLVPIERDVMFMVENLFQEKNEST
jgi:NAD(P)-dependent dehydrogenase (short-subunit alcohol dehydrogenase family)